MGARPHVALACYDYARLLARHGGPGAQTSATSIAGEASGHARDLGMVGLGGRCEALLAQLQGRPDQGQTAIASKLAREVHTGTFCVYSPDPVAPWTDDLSAESAPIHAPRP